MAGTWISATSFEEAATLVRSGGCNASALVFVNSDSAARFCQIFDVAAAASVTVGTTAPDLVIGAAAGETASVEQDVFFANGIVVAATTTPTGSGAPTANTGHIFVLVE